MKLNKNSIWAKLYRWYYGINGYDMPNNLCPYFWKLALTLFTFIPLAIITLPATIGCIVSKENVSIAAKLGMSIFLYAVLFVLTAMGCSIALFFGNFDSESFVSKAGGAGILVWLIVILVSIIEGIKAIIRWYKNRKIKYSEPDEFGNTYRIWSEPKQNIIVEFVKAKYNKYCLKIEWK